MLLRNGDERVGPLVCVHPVNGRVDAYRPLAAALTWPGPVVGLAAPYEDSYSLAELAKRYVAAIDLRASVSLFGTSIGGVIAAEMARLVVVGGGTVAFLGILDSRAPQPEMRQWPSDRESLTR